MKRIVLSVMALALIGLLFYGCDTATSPTQYYYYEFFTILITDFESVSRPSPVSFSSVKDYKDQLAESHVELIASGTDAVQSDIRGLLTDAGMSPTEANNQIFFLDSNGNNVIVFEALEDDTLYIVFYAEKL